MAAKTRSQIPLRFRPTAVDPSPQNSQTQTLLCNFLETQRPLRSIPRPWLRTLALQSRKLPLFLSDPSTGEEPQPPDIGHRTGRPLTARGASPIPLFLAPCPGSGTKPGCSETEQPNQEGFLAAVTRGIYPEQSSFPPEKSVWVSTGYTGWT